MGILFRIYLCAILSISVTDLTRFDKVVSADIDLDAAGNIISGTVITAFRSPGLIDIRIKNTAFDFRRITRFPFFQYSVSAN